MNTKLALTLLGLATLVATPAFAQKQMHRSHATDAYASAVGPTGSAEVNVGTDPDANVRFELNRDAATYSAGN